MTLKEKIVRLAQFPHKERKHPYQSYFLKGEGYIKGSRDTLYRFEQMHMPEDLTGLLVLDLGSQLGAMSVEAARRGAIKILGVEYENDFVECARELAKYNGQQISYEQSDLRNLDRSLNIIHGFFGKDEQIDLVFALSLTKHVGTVALYKLLRNIRWTHCYIEGHNCNADLTSQHCQDIEKNIISKFSSTFLGFTNDRSVRPIWRLERPAKA